MLYSRNKDSFKKTTARVEHREAHKNIINLVKEAVERDNLNKLSHTISK
jgi:arsenate reductase-like glutaredoxin family protein